MRKNRFPPNQDSWYGEWDEYFAYILNRYNITKRQWQDAWTRQKGRCAICRKAVALITDHDHKTGKFRGLLCFYCNGFLGTFEKHKTRIIKYIR